MRRIEIHRPLLLDAGKLYNPHLYITYFKLAVSDRNDLTTETKESLILLNRTIESDCIVCLCIEMIEFTDFKMVHHRAPIFSCKSRFF